MSETGKQATFPSFLPLSLAGVQCMNLSGYCKGHGYRAGQTFAGDYDHAWNAVYLEGQWHLVDSTWGSGSIDDCFSKFTFRYSFPTTAIEGTQRRYSV